MRPVAVLVLLLLLAGCLSPGPKPTDPPAGAAPDGDRTSHGGASEDGDDGPNRTVLGQASGGLSMAGRYEFTITVPAGGASDVVWQLAVWPAGAPIDVVDGPDCPYTLLESSSTTSVGSQSTTDGRCPDLEAGDLTFAVELHEPVQGFAAEVRGVLATPPAPATET